jgi:leucyl/phenylalanyl-tRNA--protein transferase
MTAWQSTPAHLPECRWQFPPASEWPRSDLVGRGADLEPETLISAYRRGVFPMATELALDDNDLAWFSPRKRAVLPLDQLRVTRSMRQSARRFEIRIDTCFERVMRGCAVPDRPGAWITEPFIDAYVQLHRLGWAHSIETFDEHGVLVGGLYGVRVDGLFAGESMFHLVRDASKVALMGLVDNMTRSEMSLLDVQWQTPHLQSLGVIEVPRTEYLNRLSSALSP